MLTYERAHELFTYEKSTGLIRRRVGRQGVKAGDLVGCPDGRGYLVFGADYQRQKAHRVAWLMTYGRWPAGEIDHIDGNPSNNRIANLRDVSPSVNSRNRSISTRNRSGLVGVCWRSEKRKWNAYIKAGDMRKDLGCFDDLLDAAAVRKSAELELGFSATHGRRNAYPRG